MKMNAADWLFVSLLICAILFQSCINDSFDYNPDNKLEFSVDTLRFDTVFTQVGSATRTLKVYNPNNEGVIIEDIRISSGDDTRFRLNIDGIPTNNAADIEVLPNDSLYIFVEVTVDPDLPLSISPFVIEEYIDFMVNGNNQNVLLEAWGQNANYVPERNATGGFALLSCDFGSVTWDDPRPYVVYGVLLIDSCDLILPAGTELYVHGGLAKTEETIYNDGLIVVLENGTIRAEGEIENPVIFQGDRLEDNFSVIPGQWGGLWITAGSKENLLENVFIKNSIVGIRADSSSQLIAKNVEIANTTNVGLVAEQASIYAENCLIHTNGNRSVALTYGGVYDFNYCTFGNYGNQFPALTLTNFTERDSVIFATNLIADFRNCIITGSGSDEIELLDISEKMDASLFQVNFDHCLVNVDELLDENQYPEFFEFCADCLTYSNGDTLFVDLDVQDFHLDTMSVAENKALFIPSIPMDIEGNLRDMNTPDIGCYEFQ